MADAHSACAVRWPHAHRQRAETGNFCVCCLSSPASEAADGKISKVNRQTGFVLIRAI